MKYKCSICGKENDFVNQCECDPNNLPTTCPHDDLDWDDGISGHKCSDNKNRIEFDYCPSCNEECSAHEIKTHGVCDSCFFEQENERKYGNWPEEE